MGAFLYDFNMLQTWISAILDNNIKKLWYFFHLKRPNSCRDNPPSIYIHIISILNCHLGKKLKLKVSGWRYSSLFVMIFSIISLKILVVGWQKRASGTDESSSKGDRVRLETGEDAIHSQLGLSDDLRWEEHSCDDVEVPKPLGDIFESFAAAVYIDSGFGKF